MRILILLLFLFLNILFAEDFNKIEAVKNFKKELIQKYNFKQNELDELFSNVKIQEDSLWFYNKPKQTNYKEYFWSDYNKNFLSEKKVNAGVKFLKEYNKFIHKAYKEYKIPGEYIVAIIGIESNFGGFMGNHPVFDTLATLAFKKNRREKFFKKELESYLIMIKKEKIDAKELKGSFAGAIGYCQFMPSNFSKIAVDHDKNGQIRLDKPIDAIGSVANYLKISGWKRGIPVATQVKFEGKRFDLYESGYKTLYDRSELKTVVPFERFYYGDKVTLIKLKNETHDELWYGTKNFRVLISYNRSPYYVMAVHQLAMKIKEAYLKSKKSS